jgi:DNA-binding transcriptional MerR regulator
MFRIGDFSKLSRVSSKALRYYDEIGLFRPIHVDAATGYRYYSLSQLPRLYRLLVLRDLGFPLEQMRPLLDGDLATEELRGMLRLRQAEQQQHVAEEQARLRRVEALIKQIDEEGDTMQHYAVVLKPLPPLTVASARDIAATIADLPAKCQALTGEAFQLMARLGGTPAGPCFAIYHNAEWTGQDIDVEVAVPIMLQNAAVGVAPGDGRAIVKGLPGAPLAASTVHDKGFETIGDAYTAIGRWIEANGYRVGGPAREIYLTMPGQGVPVVEIQFPVERS